MAMACRNASWCPARKKLRRFHLTCLTCRRRRSKYGKMPKQYLTNAQLYFVNDIPYMLLKQVGRRLAKVKDILINLVLTEKFQFLISERFTVAEFLAN